MRILAFVRIRVFCNNSYRLSDAGTGEPLCPRGNPRCSPARLGRARSLDPPVKTFAKKLSKSIYIWQLLWKRVLFKMNFVTKIRSIKLSAYIMRIWDSFYVTVGPHTFKVYSHEERNTMKKKKLLSYILSTSLLISLTSNPVLAMTGGEYRSINNICTEKTI